MCLTKKSVSNLSTEQLFLTEAAKALLENKERSPFLNLGRYQLWDVAGIDALQLVRLLCSDAVAKLALFQSLDVIFTGYQYSVLRLGEEKFRLSLYGELGDYGGLTFLETIAQSQIGLQVSAKFCDQIKAIALKASCADNAPHSLARLQSNRAAPTRVEGFQVLIWRHQLLSQPVLEFHARVGDADAIEVKLSNTDILHQSHHPPGVKSPG